MRLIKIVSISLIAIVLGGAFLFAHQGKRDAYGCHNNRKAGDYHCHSGPLAGQVFSTKAEMLKALKGAGAGDPVPPGQQQERSVMFNTKSLKYHSPSCQWAIKCTRNCITIPLSDAIKRGGIPCKVCGGS